MKKMLFLMVVGFGGTMLLKHGYVTITPDNQVRIAGWAVPIPPSVRASPVMGMVTTLFQGNLGPQTTAASAARPGYPVRPALPTVTSAVGTYNANAPSDGQTPGSEQFNTVSKALH